MVFAASAIRLESIRPFIHCEIAAGCISRPRANSDCAPRCRVKMRRISVRRIVLDSVVISYLTLLTMMSICVRA